MRLNPVPPWVRDVLTGDRSFDGPPVVPILQRLAGKVPPSWLPARRGEALEDELGCGTFGCVLRTNDPSVVLKLSADEAEATFVAWMISLGDTAPADGIVRYWSILKTEWTHGIPHYDKADLERERRDSYASPAEPKFYEQLPVCLIWREAAIHVGVRNMRTRPPEPPLPSFEPTGLARRVLEKEWREHEEGWGHWAMSFDEFVTSKAERNDRLRAEHEAALEAWRRTRWFDRTEIETAKRLWGDLAHYYYAARTLGKLARRSQEGQVASDRDVAIAEGHVAESIELLSKNSSGRWIAETLRELQALDVVLYDLHEGNIGLVLRDGEERWVVTDPSQAVFLRGAPAVTIPSA